MTATTSTPIRRRRRAARTNAAETAWMGQGACLSRGDLPWTTDPDHATAWEQLAMAATCQDCPMLGDCDRYATKEKTTAGFWAGKNRDRDTPAGLTGPGWALEALPGLGGLGGAA